MVPEPFIPKVGARIMSLQEPTKKMSKSDDNENNMVALLDTPKTIEKKFKRAVTDSGTEVRFDVENKAGVSNLLTIHSAFSGQSIADLEAHFAGKMYGHLKVETAEAVIEGLKPIQARYNELMADKTGLEDILAAGAENATHRAHKTLSKVYKKIGLVPRKHR